jgi:ACS family sodium-dependent inorganic phosphate cotransporter-like MFS transporter 5
MAMFLCSIPVGFLSDYLLNTGCLSAGSIRKIFNSMGSLGPALGMVWLAYVGCNSTMAVVALVLSTALCSGAYAGFNVRVCIMGTFIRAGEKVC